MFLDTESYRITELYLIINFSVSFTELKYKLEENYSDLLVRISDEFVIMDKDFKIMIKKSV